MAKYVRGRMGRTIKVETPKKKQPIRQVKNTGPNMSDAAKRLEAEKTTASAKQRKALEAVKKMKAKRWNVRKALREGTAVKNPGRYKRR